MNFLLRTTPAVFAALVTLTVLGTSTVRGDVILTFDQNGISNGVAVDQSYGDNVTQSPDGNGHQYGISGSTTPNIEAIYFGAGFEGNLWTSGYGDLSNVLYKASQNGVLDIVLEDQSNPNSEVYLKSFDLAAFGSDRTLTNVRILGSSDVELWSSGSTLISGTSRTSFNFVNENGFGLNGIFDPGRVTIQLVYTGMGADTDNIGIDNIRFSQSAIPEPASAAILLLGSLGICLRRRRK